MPGTVIQLVDAAVLGQCFLQIFFNDVHMSNLLCFLIQMDLFLEVPGTAIHLDDTAVLDHHLSNIILDGILNRHSQIPPL